MLDRAASIAACSRPVLLAIAAALFTGCVAVVGPHGDAAAESAPPASVNFDDPLLSQRKLLLTSAVNEASAREIISKLLLLEARSAEPIDLYLNTSGGPIQHGFAIIDIVRSLKAPVNTWAVGNCNSAGAMILAAGTGRRRALPHALITIHGGVKQGRIPPDYLRIVEPQIDAFWQEHARLPAAWFPLQGDEPHFLTPETAVEHGVIDEVVAVARPK